MISLDDKSDSHFAQVCKHPSQLLDKTERHLRAFNIEFRKHTREFADNREYLQIVNYLPTCLYQFLYHIPFIYPGENAWDSEEKHNDSTRMQPVASTGVSRAMAFGQSKTRDRSRKEWLPVAETGTLLTKKVCTRCCSLNRSIESKPNGVGSRVR